MKQVNRIIPFAFASILAVNALISSCNRGNTIGAVGFDDPDGLETFDTFNLPTADFYFYGKFDGGFKVWQDGLRSKWDTATRINNTGIPNAPWSEWGVYTENIYQNIPEENGDLPCINDSNNIWFEQVSRFLIPGVPEERMEIFFYDCLPHLDTINESMPFHGEILTNLGWTDYGVAQPFTNTEFGRRGVRLVYTDNQRNRWETKAGSGQTIDSYFRIHDFYERIVNTDTLDTLHMYIVEGEFAGRLYNGIREIPVTEARFRARLIPQVTYEP